MTTPIREKKTMSVAAYLFADIMLKFGFPRILHSDNGVEFNLNLWKTFHSNFIYEKFSFPLTTHKQMKH